MSPPSRTTNAQVAQQFVLVARISHQRSEPPVARDLHLFASIAALRFLLRSLCLNPTARFFLSSWMAPPCVGRHPLAGFPAPKSCSPASSRDPVATARLVLVGTATAVLL